MAGRELLNGIPPGIIGLVVTIIYLLSIWAGFQFGIRAKHKHEKIVSVITYIQSSALGLLALLLSFTFAMAASRFETRRDLINQESNAISDAYLRAYTLLDPTQAEVIKLLQQYIEVRITDYLSDYDPHKIDALEAESERMQWRIWEKVIEVFKADPTGNRYTPLLESVNHMIDLFSQRSFAMANHVPEIIIFLLVLVSFLTISLTGYVQGLQEYRNLTAGVILVFLIGFVTLVIIDLDRPRQGLAVVNAGYLQKMRISKLYNDFVKQEK